MKHLKTILLFGAVFAASQAMAAAPAGWVSESVPQFDGTFTAALNAKNQPVAFAETVSGDIADSSFGLELNEDAVPANSSTAWVPESKVFGDGQYIVANSGMTSLNLGKNLYEFVGVQPELLSGQIFGASNSSLFYSINGGAPISMQLPNVASGIMVLRSVKAVPDQADPSKPDVFVAFDVDQYGVNKQSQRDIVWKASYFYETKDLGRTWHQLKESTQLYNSFQSIAAYKNQVYVLLSETDQVDVFNQVSGASPATYETQIQSPGDLEGVEPQLLANSDNLYLTDENGKVFAYSFAAKKWNQISYVTNPLGGLQDIALDDKGNLYVATDYHVYEVPADGVASTLLTASDENTFSDMSYSKGMLFISEGQFKLGQAPAGNILSKQVG